MLPQVDRDLAAMAKEQLVEEVRKLRNAIREHRDSTGQELCWHHPRLWGLLPEQTDPLPVVPAWPEFLRGCVRYRQSLDEQAPAQPRSREEYEDLASPHSDRTVAAVLWRRLDAPGHDVCRLDVTPTGWVLAGTALFRYGQVPARVDYQVACDAEWRARHGRVHGWFGRAPIDVTVARTTERGWLLSSLPVAGLADCLDLDFDFTPATNLLHLRRLAMTEGQGGDVPVALLRLPEGTLARLDQRLQRRAARNYWYEAPGVGYAGLLDVHPTGFVTHYPGLWEAEALEVLAL